MLKLGSALVAGLILLVVLVGGLTLVGWQVGWWFKTQNTAREAHLYQNSYGAQSAYVEQVRNDIAQVKSVDTQLVDMNTPAAEKPALTAQRASMVTQACSLAANITMVVPSDIAAFQQANCH